MATDTTNIVRGTLKNAAGTALANATVKVSRLGGAAVAASLLDSTQTSASEFSGTTDSSGIFSITLTHALAPTNTVTYRVDLPDKRYFTFDIKTDEVTKTFDFGTLPCESSPANVRDINITNLALKNLRTMGESIATANTASTLRVQEEIFGFTHNVKITLTSFPIALVDEPGVVAYGGAKLLDLPEGAIVWGGAVADLAIAKSSAGVNNDWDGDISLGTVTASNNGTLSTTEQDLIPTTATPQAVAGATTGDMLSTATEVGAVLDGTGTAKDVFLNVLVDDADHDVTGTACNLLFTGTISMQYTRIGDK